MEQLGTGCLELHLKEAYPTGYDACVRKVGCDGAVYGPALDEAVSGLSSYDTSHSLYAPRHQQLPCAGCGRAVSRYQSSAGIWHLQQLPTMVQTNIRIIRKVGYRFAAESCKIVHHNILNRVGLKENTQTHHFFAQISNSVSGEIQPAGRRPVLYGGPDMHDPVRGIRLIDPGEKKVGCQVAYLGTWDIHGRQMRVDDPGLR